MEALPGMPVVASPSAKTAIRGADVVPCATNSLRPVLQRDWLSPRMHIGSIRDRGLLPEVVKAVDRVIIPPKHGSEHLVLAHGVDYQRDEGDRRRTATIKILIPPPRPARYNERTVRI